MAVLAVHLDVVRRAEAPGAPTYNGLFANAQEYEFLSKGIHTIILVCVWKALHAVDSQRALRTVHLDVVQDVEEPTRRPT